MVVSAGSKYVGASEVCTPQVSCPSGAAVAGATASDRAMTTRAPTRKLNGSHAHRLTFPAARDYGGRHATYPRALPLTVSRHPARPLARLAAWSRHPVVRLAQAAKPPAGEMRWGLHVTLAARWLDPAETEAFSTPFMVMYAIHDAMVKPMPAGLMTPSLAESWTEAKDHLTYTFVLRKGARFHNGEPVTAEDVKFSWDRYKGASAKLLKDKVKEVRSSIPARCASCSRSRGPTSSPSTAPPRRAPAGSCPRSTSRRWATTASRRADRGRALQGRLVQARRRAGAGGLRRLLAQGAVGEAPGDALDAGGDARGPPR